MTRLAVSGALETRIKNSFIWGVLHVWLTLGGRLTYTLAPDDGKVSGKAFDFFAACVRPLLRNQTLAAGFADLIDRMRGKTDRELISNYSPLGRPRGRCTRPSPEKFSSEATASGNA